MSMPAFGSGWQQAPVEPVAPQPQFQPQIVQGGPDDSSLAGQQVLPPALPQQMAAPGQRPAWPAMPPQAHVALPPAPAPPQQFQPAQFQPAAPAPPQFRQAPQPPQPFQPPPAPPGAPGNFQFNDGMPLAGPVAGHAARPAPRAAAPPPAPGIAPPPPAAPPANGMVVPNDELQRLRFLAGRGLEALARQNGGGTAAPALEQRGNQALSPPPPSANTPPGQRPSPPEWREEWDPLVRLDEETGRYVATDPLAVNPAIVERANEYASWRRRQVNALLTNPVEALRQQGLDELKTEWKREILAELQQQERQEQSQSRVRQFIDQNQALLFQVGQDGQPVTGWDGNLVPTPAGQRFFAICDEYTAGFKANYGIEPDYAHVAEFAKLRLDAEMGRPAAPANGYPPQQQPQAAPPQQTVARAAFGAMYSPQSTGTIAAAAQQATQPQNPRLSFGQQLQQAAIQRGILPAQW